MTGPNYLTIERSNTNLTDWRYLLPQSLQPPYLYIAGSGRPLAGLQGALQGELVEGFIPLRGREIGSLQQLVNLAAREDSYSLVVWELDIERPMGFMPSRYLQSVSEQVAGVIARDGSLYLAVRRRAGNFTRVHYMMDLLMQAGLHNCRAYYVLPSHAHPMHFVPANDPLLMRYYLYHVASARSSRRKRMVALARLLARLNLDSLFPLMIPCFGIVAERRS